MPPCATCCSATRPRLRDAIAAATGLQGHEVALLLIVEGLTQGWTLHDARALDAAQALGALLRADAAKSPPQGFAPPRQ